jgi:hypothetical protein
MRSESVAPSRESFYEFSLNSEEVVEIRLI